eukprot:3261741-Prymnesium_polylepis.1
MCWEARAVSRYRPRHLSFRQLDQASRAKRGQVLGLAARLGSRERRRRVQGSVLALLAALSGGALAGALDCEPRARPRVVRDAWGRRRSQPVENLHQAAACHVEILRDRARRHLRGLDGLVLDAALDGRRRRRD